MRHCAYLILMLAAQAVNASPDNHTFLNLISDDQKTPASSLIFDSPANEVDWGQALFSDHSVQSKPKFYRTVLRYSHHYNVPADLVFGIIKTESNFNPDAISHKGAKGLMQLMDMNSRHWKIDPFLPDQNIKVGTAMIARLLEKYDGNIELALAAYNAGEGTVRKYKGVPPFKETQQYIVKVKKNMKLFSGISPPVGSFPSLFISDIH
ncbi:lytic transglycosylase domain-containing protein [Photobacterium sp. OFAV2-7]|uniref:lytic transglycosylase domain-containing protein n=1 Tax=Photobacterium sp. OFAV2-7 TaxID=2917748 RepID=UPI001EF6E1DD|nr:lytic transglycosylase domain-containing protein [Photobacterium sp. OFAV2-7]MCG7586258.1 lytic transglycosylase domain-containing protein [Photobacterium sp. OFAV2-7]